MFLKVYHATKWANLPHVIIMYVTIINIMGKLDLLQLTVDMIQ